MSNLRNLSSDDVDAMNAETEEDAAAEEKNKALETAAPTNKRFWLKIFVADADEADHRGRVGRDDQSGRGHDADRCEGHGQEAHLNKVRHWWRIKKNPEALK